MNRAPTDWRPPCLSGPLPSGHPVRPGAIHRAPHSRFAGIQPSRSVRSPGRMAASDGRGELVRVTRPGGWIELLELSDVIQPAGPATRRLLDWFTTISRQLGFEAEVLRRLGELLQQAGCVDVTSQDIPVPLGRWAGATGQLVLTDVLHGFDALKDSYGARTNTPAAVVETMLREAAQEWERLQARYVFHAAYGRRPEP